MKATEAEGICRRIADNIETVIRGKTSVIRKVVAALISRGHVLLEDYPGTGKTTLAKTLAMSIAVRYRRIQFTPDLLPSDILGVSVFDPHERLFRFHEGPVFTNILLADEINRASPRTQSALLEAMAESQVSIDGKLYRLENPFFVIATQNPVEFRGTYPLPEAQMDRFALRLSLGYVSEEEEMAILNDQNEQHPIDSVKPCVSPEDIIRLQKCAAGIRISDELRRYIVTITAATRTWKDVELGASPRASLALMKTAQALALTDGSEFVTPDHIVETAVPVLAHRLALTPEAKYSGRKAEWIVEEILKQIPIPL
jgi:MoxR-like ATPase